MAVLRCTEAFAFQGANGGPVVVTPGELRNSDDPAVKGREDKFEAVEVTAARSSTPVVEQATAAPGEKRTVTRATKAAK